MTRFYSPDVDNRQCIFFLLVRKSSASIPRDENKRSSRCRVEPASVCVHRCVHANSSMPTSCRFTMSCWSSASSVACFERNRLNAEKILRCSRDMRTSSSISSHRLLRYRRDSIARELSRWKGSRWCCRSRLRNARPDRPLPGDRDKLDPSFRIADASRRYIAMCHDVANVTIPHKKGRKQPT
jgi:hypothetical protein